MKRLGIMFAISAFAFALMPGSAVSQQKSSKDQLIGTWTLVSWEQTRKDGSKNHPLWNDSPKASTRSTPMGTLRIIMRPDLPKIAAGDPEKPTPEEAQAVARGAIAYFGTYTVNSSTRQ